MATAESSRSITRFETVPESPQPWELCSCGEGRRGGRRLTSGRTGRPPPRPPHVGMFALTRREKGWGQGKKTGVMRSRLM